MVHSWVSLTPTPHRTHKTANVGLSVFTFLYLSVVKIINR